MQRRQLGQLEAEVLAALSETPDRALSTAELQARIPGDPAYTTINTVLFRLHDKGLVTRERDGRSFRYRIAVDEARLVAGRMHDHLRYASDSFNVLSQFVKTLSPAEEEALRRILEDG
ncbi:CopY family transcriptional repressor [Actinocorallia herbida]|uniref:CopY family transcriptional repressor n=1 Tax=Actinocorallia herbida TaxID=58109 RepID=A0A3N1D6E1_9ACTN|nr:BlaI/MecI/CopY family transcriptional regulator [Actinocorallia herbida]ROO89029.1 CopY family transcriptional repressor [Actinocorallia herbida]